MIPSINSSESKEDIVKRLEKLNKWQEEQKKLLHERQNLQRQLLGMEQRKMYEMLGLLDNESVIAAANNPNSSADVGCVGEEQPITNNNSNVDENIAHTGGGIKPKRRYLRRGEGLKQRFKMDPDALRLNNLPRYKYSKIHSRLIKKSSTKNGNELNQNNKLDLQQEELMDIQEKRFQQLLISSNNFCNSTPDMKHINYGPPQLKDVSLPKVRFSSSDERTCERNDELHTPDELIPDAVVSWAKVLDTQKIKPVSIHMLRPAENLNTRTEDTDENLDIFELIEQKASEGSIDMNSSCIRKLMKSKENERKHDEKDEIPVQSALQTAGLMPAVNALQSSAIADEMQEDTIEEEILEEEEEAEKEEGAETDYDCTLTSKIRSTESTRSVHFAEDHDTHEYAEESETSFVGANESSSFEIFEQFKEALFAAIKMNDNSVNDSIASSKNKTPAVQAQIQQLGSQKVFSEDLQAVIELVKTRLLDLEKEIATFKDNNVRLIKAKQEHELEKTIFDEERREAMNKLNDEKIRMEIYLHDERTKIEEEKRTFERQMQMQKSSFSSKERKEIAKLKEDLERMEAQLKQREKIHLVAQARLRAQLRNLEKELKQLYDEREQLMKDNKRLQNENVKISRENNNKMLQEINRNIAKLAPKLALITQDDDAGCRKEPTNSNCKNNETKQQEQQKMRSKRHPVVYKHCSKENKKSDTSLSSDCEDCEDNPNQTKQKKNSVKDECATICSNLPKSNSSINNPKAETSIADEFKREITNPDGSKDILYANGNVKKISADGMSIRMLYFNKDIKETNINEGIIKYYYAESNTWHTTYMDGLEILEFPNGQTEHRHKNGIVEVYFPNNSIKLTNPANQDVLEEWRYADGTNMLKMQNGDKILTLPNGQKEIHTKLNKRREYPDGTVKFVYPDGSQETRYSNGRIRLKDKDGQLIMDSESCI